MLLSVSEEAAAPAEMYDAVYLLAPRGAVLLSRTYGGREVPHDHLAAFERALFSRLYIQSAPPVVCIGDGRDKTTFIYILAVGSGANTDTDAANTTSVGLEASLQRTDAALRHRGSGGVVAAVACRGNPNAVLALVLLRRLLSLLQECAVRAAPISALGALGLRRSQANLNEAFILSHSDVVFEILDEAIDAGVPQTSDPKVLLLFAEANAGLRGSSGGSSAQAQSSEAGTKLAAQATGTTSWRRPGIRHRKNEVFIDVVEKVHALVAQNGTVLRQEVEGKVLVRCFLSGMPECKLATNELMAVSERPGTEGSKIQAITNSPLPGAAAEAARSPPGGILPGPDGGTPVVAQRAAADTSGKSGALGGRGTVRLSACRYHQCVRIAKHPTEKTMAFTPPDGNCELMTYRQVEVEMILLSRFAR